MKLQQYWCTRNYVLGQGYTNMLSQMKYKKNAIHKLYKNVVNIPGISQVLSFK